MHMDIIKTSTDHSLQFTPEELAQIKAFFKNGKNHTRANYTGTSSHFCSSSSTQETYLNQWIIDSDATNHIAYFITNFTHLSSQIALPNGAYSKITGIDSTELSDHLHIKDILYAPFFHVNLLPVSKLTADLNCSIHFFPTFCILQDLASKKMISLGK